LLLVSGGVMLRVVGHVLAQRNFRTFYLGYVTSWFGTAMSGVALAWAVLESTHNNATDLGYVMAADVVPQVVLMTFAGAIADRLGRRRVMLAADVLRCGAQATLAIAVFAGHPPLWMFLLLGWLAGTGDAFFTPSLQALTVEIAPPDQLGNANTLFGLAQSATRIAGPSLSGGLVALAGPGVVIAVDAATYAVSALALSALRLPSSSPGASRDDAGPRRTLLRDMAEGWTDFWSRTWLWVVSVQWAFFNLITWAPWMLLGPVMGRSYLGGSAVWGAIMATQGAGAIVAGLLFLGRRPRRPMVLATLAMFGYTMPDIPLALHAAAPWVAMAAFSCGAGSAISSACFSTALQQQVPPDRLARASSLSMFSSYGIGVIGYGIDGPLAAAFGAPAVFAVGACYGILSSAVVLSVPAVRAVRWRERSPSGSGPARDGAERGEGGEAGRHRDQDRHGEDLRDVGGGGEGDDAERYRYAADG
jgi:MFS family permease